MFSLYHLIFLRTSITFFGNAFRLQGIFLLWLLLVFSMLSSKFSFKKISPKIYWLVSIGVVVSSLIIGSDRNGRLIGTLGDPNNLAAFIIFLWPFLFFRIQTNMLKVKIFKYLILLFLIIILLLTGSRSGLTAFIIQNSLIYLTYILKLSSINASIICFIIYGFSLFFPFMENHLRENRSIVWQTAYHAGWQNPIFGGGLGNTEYLLKKASLQLNNNLQSLRVDSSHNIFLDWWLEGGFVGILLLLFILIQTSLNFIKGDKFLELTLYFGLLTLMSFNPSSVTSLLSFWWLIGQ